MKFIEILDLKTSEIKSICENSCNNENLKQYLCRFSKNHSNNGLFKTYILKIANNYIGFISFSISIIENSVYEFEKIKDLTDISQNLKYSLPSIKITRLCIFEEYKKQGFGSIMITFAEIIAIYIQKQIGCKLLIVDSKIESYKFYQKNGLFKISEDSTIFMIKKIISPKEFKQLDKNLQNLFLENIKSFCKTFDLNFFNEINNYLQRK